VATVNDICDKLAALIEPDPTLRDDSCAQPSTYDPDRLYVWPRIVLMDPEGDGSVDRERFDIRVEWAADRLGEGEPDREVSDAIAARAYALAAVVRANRTNQALWDSLSVGFDFEALRGFDVRGFRASVQGYMLRSE